MRMPPKYRIFDWSSKFMGLLCQLILNFASWTRSIISFPCQILTWSAYDTYYITTHKHRNLTKFAILGGSCTHPLLSNKAKFGTLWSRASVYAYMVGIGSYSRPWKAKTPKFCRILKFVVLWWHQISHNFNVWPTWSSPQSCKFHKNRARGVYISKLGKNLTFSPDTPSPVMKYSAEESTVKFYLHRCNVYRVRCENLKMAPWVT